MILKFNLINEKITGVEEVDIKVLDHYYEITNFHEKGYSFYYSGYVDGDDLLFINPYENQYENDFTQNYKLHSNVLNYIKCYIRENEIDKLV